MDVWGIVAGAVIGGVVAIALGAVNAYFRARFKSRGEENAEALQKIGVALQKVVDAQGRQFQTLFIMLDTNETLLEAAHGNCNGNIEAALKKNREEKQDLQGFLVKERTAT